MSLPGVHAETPRFAFAVERKGKSKAFVWTWQERIDPRKARVPNDKVVAVRVADQDEKAAILSVDGDKFFTEPHYDGYPAVLVRLAEVSVAELRKLVVDAWRCLAPEAAVAAFDAKPRKRAPAKKR